jgi:hypothetical protein
MANKATHDLGGFVAGAGLACWLSQGQKPEHVVAETLGGAFMGLLFSRLPDVLDPPVSPNHRHIAHGTVTAMVTGSLYLPNALAWQRQFRQRADQLAPERTWATNELARLSSSLQETMLRALAGAVVGAVAGYGSDLVLDATTPRGLPLIVRGF